MGSRAARRAWQDAELRDQDHQAAARPNEPPREIPEAQKCPVGGAHDFTMKGRDGIRRCWYCARRKP
jgi:hypothetical protein